MQPQAEVDKFREVLLSHARTPRHSGVVADATAHGQCTNPLCGDKVHVTLRLQDDVVTEIKSQTAGCSMSIASTSMMCDLIEGKSKTEIENLRTALSEALLQKPGTGWPQDLGPLLPLSHLRESPTRVPCALMGWFALKDALKSRASSDKEE